MLILAAVRASFELILSLNRKPNFVIYVVRLKLGIAEGGADYNLIANKQQTTHRRSRRNETCAP